MPTVPPAERQGATRALQRAQSEDTEAWFSAQHDFKQILNFPKPSSWALKKVGVKSGTLTVSPLTDSPRKERDDRKENCQKWAELEPGPEGLRARTHACTHFWWEDE